MIIFSSGMPRSASTWCYNVCRLILEVTNNLFMGGFVGESTKVDNYLQENSNFQGYFLIKSHNPGPISLYKIQSKQAKNIYTYRDPRDTLCSRLIFTNSNNFDLDANNTVKDLMQQDFLRQTSDTLFINYINIINNPFKEIIKIAEYLNFSLSELEVEQINNKTSLDNSKNLIKKLNDITKTEEVQNQKFIDQKTLLHNNHIFSGKQGRWLEELNLEQQLITNCIFKPWLIDLQYETEDSMTQILTSLFKNNDWQKIANKYITKKDYLKVKSIYELAIEIEDNPDYYWNLGMVYLLDENPEEAEMIWMNAILEGDIETEMPRLIELLKTEVKRQEELADLEKVELLENYLQQLN